MTDLIRINKFLADSGLCSRRKADELISMGKITINGQTITGPLVGISTLGELISKILIFLFPIAATILVFVFIWGGYDYMMSKGNPEKVKAGQAKITTGLIGFIIIVAAYMIVRVIAKIFGLGSGIL